MAELVRVAPQGVCRVVRNGIGSSLGPTLYFLSERFR